MYSSGYFIGIFAWGHSTMDLLIILSSISGPGPGRIQNLKSAGESINIECAQRRFNTT